MADNVGDVWLYFLNKTNISQVLATLEFVLGLLLQTTETT